MKKSVFCFILCILTFCLIPQILIAKTGYVSDMLLLTFREGPGKTFTVIKTLKSDTALNIIGEQNGFFKVELQSRETGWVDKNFVVFDTPKATIIRQLEQTIASIENKNVALLDKHQELKNRLNASNNDNVIKIQTLESSLNEMRNDKQKLSKSLKDTQKKYDTLIQQSKDIQSIIEENKAFKTTNEKLTVDLEMFKKKNKTLFKTGMIKWFLAGVATLLVGWILGQSVSSRKRSGSSLLD